MLPAMTTTPPGGEDERACPALPNRRSYMLDGAFAGGIGKILIFLLEHKPSSRRKGPVGRYFLRAVDLPEFR